MCIKRGGRQTSPETHGSRQPQTYYNSFSKNGDLVNNFVWKPLISCALFLMALQNDILNKS